MEENKMTKDLEKKEAGLFVVVLADNYMGRGDDVLGHTIMRSFIHTLQQLNPLPQAIICYNAGVKLAIRDSDALDDLRKLEKAGVDIMICGACINYFNLGEQVGVGHLCHMDDIVETLAGAGRIVRP